MSGAQRFFILATDNQGGPALIGPYTGQDAAQDAQDTLEQFAMDNGAYSWEFGSVARVLSPAQARREMKQSSSHRAVN